MKNKKKFLFSIKIVESVCTFLTSICFFIYWLYNLKAILILLSSFGFAIATIFIIFSLKEIYSIK
ncbi:hypothetical protein [Clostridium grantii]|uniref:hypothetical protein n=1 Tax=Clostridium grantii TaxID=40575 RepID=UPI0009352E38|nr:hypothetical protein [Clostridium grantii]